MRPHIAVCGEMVKEGAQRLVVHGGEQRQPTWASEVFGADSADEETSLTVSTRLPGGFSVHTFDEFRNLQEELGNLGSSADCASPMEADGMPSTSDHHEVRRLPAVEPPGHHFEVAVDEQQAPLQQHHHPSTLATSRRPSGAGKRVRAAKAARRTARARPHPTTAVAAGRWRPHSAAPLRAPSSGRPGAAQRASCGIPSGASG